MSLYHTKAARMGGGLYEGRGEGELKLRLEEGCLGKKGVVADCKRRKKVYGGISPAENIEIIARQAFSGGVDLILWRRRNARGTGGGWVGNWRDAKLKGERLDGVKNLSRWLWMREGRKMTGWVA